MNWLARKNRITVAILLGIIAGLPKISATHFSISTEATVPEYNGVRPRYSGTYTITAYCKNSCCCGEYADGFTASGKPAIGRIVAAPPNIPFGTVLEIEGHGEYTVEDRGGAIKGNRLDILKPTHQAALEWGVKTLTVEIEE